MALLVPFQALSEEALQGLLEEFATRDGTDYGEREVPLGEKVAALRQQLKRGEIVILYSEVDGSCTLTPPPG